jgi:hypothetical protein
MCDAPAFAEYVPTTHCTHVAFVAFIPFTDWYHPAEQLAQSPMDVPAWAVGTTYWPGAQDCSKDAPGGQTLPTLQTAQLETFVDEGLGLNVPATQSVHAERETASEYLPGTQGSQAIPPVVPRKEPIEQFWQKLFPVSG